MSDNVKLPVLDLTGIVTEEKTSEKSGKAFLEIKNNTVEVAGKLYRVYTSGFGAKSVLKLYPIEASVPKHEVKSGRLERVEAQLATLIAALGAKPATK